jgi:microcystin-dependent protein
MNVGEIRRQHVYGSVEGLAECAGQMMSVASNTVLFMVIGNQYGGDGKVTFALPNLPVESGPKYYIATSGYFPSYE